MIEQEPCLTKTPSAASKDSLLAPEKSISQAMRQLGAGVGKRTTHHDSVQGSELMPDSDAIAKATMRIAAKRISRSVPQRCWFGWQRSRTTRYQTVPLGWR
jgi:hypothetical protein